MLGAWLREQYGVDEDIYVRSTAVNRTIQSAHSALLGLYDLGTSEVDYGSKEEYSV